MANEMKDERLRQFRLWFFRDLSDDQRIALFRLTMHDVPADQLGTYSAQGAALEHVLSELALRPQREDAGAGGVVVALKAVEEIWSVLISEDLSAAEQVESIMSHAAPVIRGDAARARVAAPQPSAPEGLREEGLREARRIALKVGNFGDYRRDELTADLGQPRYDMMVKIVNAIDAALASPSPPTGRDATEEGWQDISTAKIDELIDVYIWSVGDSGPEDGFRWADVKLISAMPQIISICHDEGEWVDYDLSQNGQFISHWCPLPAAPKPETAQKGGKP